MPIRVRGQSNQGKQGRGNDIIRLVSQTDIEYYNSEGYYNTARLREVTLNVARPNVLFEFSASAVSRRYHDVKCITIATVLETTGYQSDSVIIAAHLGIRILRSYLLEIPITIFAV